MAPLYDTDLAEERFDKAKWESYELWEKVELRLRRNKILWISGTAFLILVLFSIPILADQKPKRSSLQFTRILAQAIGTLKLTASTKHVAMRLRFSDLEKLHYEVSAVADCASNVPLRSPATRLEQLSSSAGIDAGKFVLIEPVLGRELGIPGLTSEFCYDPMQGSHAAISGDDPLGFGIIPADDLKAKRFDRMSILVLSGYSAEISFD